AIRALLQPLMEDRPLLVLYVPGVMLAAFWGGVGAGLLATLLSLIGSLLLFQSPTWDTPGDLINDATFLLVGVGIAFLGEGLRRTRAQADARTAALASREAHLKSILDTVPDAMIVIDERGIVTSFSAAAERLFGYPTREIVGRNVKALMPEPYRS